MKTFLKTFFSDQRGASAAEYALILSIIGVALGAAAIYLSVQIQGAVNNAGNQVAAGCPEGDCGNIEAEAATKTLPE